MVSLAVSPGWMGFIFEDFFRYLQAPVTLRLKVKAQVMYLSNNPDEGIYNGSRGVVSGFTTAQIRSEQNRGLWVKNRSQFRYDEVSVLVPLVSFYPNKGPSVYAFT
jgi:hypothetical protein